MAVSPRPGQSGINLPDLASQMRRERAATLPPEPISVSRWADPSSWGLSRALLRLLGGREGGQSAREREEVQNQLHHPPLGPPGSVKWRASSLPTSGQTATTGALKQSLGEHCKDSWVRQVDLANSRLPSLGPLDLVGSQDLLLGAPE